MLKFLNRLSWLYLNSINILNTDAENKIAAFAKAFEPFVPQGTAEMLGRWIIHFNFDLKITQVRQSKFGDYRPPHKGKRHQITVNGNLNPYAFLVTLVHEIAHLTTHEKFGHHIKPHGTEWKEQFRLLMEPFFQKQIFPHGLSISLRKYLQNAAASSCTDEDLYRALKQFDKPGEKFVHVEDIPLHSVFKFGKNRYFRKGERIRKRYKCVEMNSGHQYLFNPLAEVILVQGGLF